MIDRAPGALAGVRVLDLATPLAELAGRVLADLGADVLKVEPPAGARSRMLPPFAAAAAADAGQSLYWAAVGRGKRSCTLDLDSAQDREALHALLAQADILIECFAPSTARALHLAPEDLAARHPHLVHVSVTPFGRTGPKADAPASDLTVEAAGGLLGLQGAGDRPPVPVGFAQASFHAGVQAASDALIALHARRTTGRGQHLDVSAQQAMVWTLMNAAGYLPMTGMDPPGTGSARAEPAEVVPGVRLPRIVACADGYIALGVNIPGIGERTMAALMARALASGPDDPALAQVDWTAWLAPLREGRFAPELANAALQRLQSWLMLQPRRALQELAVQEGILIASIQRPGELHADPQLMDRGFWTQIGKRTHPGAFARLSATPIHANLPAPASATGQPAFATFTPRRAAGALARQGADSSVASAAFAGLKVADFAWVGVGPIISKALADHGATVVHVESSTRPDVLRNLPPFQDGVRDPNRAHFMANFNTSKRGIALDMQQEDGRAIARRLADWADVVVESFTPGTMGRLGLDHATLAAARPDLVMLSTCMRGQTGPERRYSGFGNQGASLAGIVAITGWPDRAPCGPWGAYTDFIAPRYGVAALIAALHHRADTGIGQHIDLSQIEAGIQFIEPLLLACADQGVEAPAAGHWSMFASPHGVFACAGNERYLALAVETDAQWRGLARVLDDAALAHPHYDSEALRRRDAARIDSAINRWCAPRDAFAAAQELRTAGVPAEAVLRPSDLYLDAQLNHRGHFVRLRHTAMGEVPFDGLQTRFSRAIQGPFTAAPVLGEHTREVLREVLGYDDAAIARFEAAGVLR